MLAVATDGVYTREDIVTPKPDDTDTWELPDDKGKIVKKPLGGWEVKEYPNGVFAARPGIYFPLDPTEDDIAKVRARGLGRRVLYEQHRLAMQAYERGESSVVLGARACDVATREEQGTTRFVGAKTGLSWCPKQGVKRSENYGEWIDWPTEVSFDPKPKRERILEGGRLKCWDYFEAPSLPYEAAIKSDEDKLLELAELIAIEQPDGDFADIGGEGYTYG